MEAEEEEKISIEDMVNTSIRGEISTGKEALITTETTIIEEGASEVVKDMEDKDQTGIEEIRIGVIITQTEMTTERDD